VPRIWGLSALADQQIGGLIMKLLGAAVFLVAMGVVFFIWYNREGRDTRVQPFDGKALTGGHG